MLVLVLVLLFLLLLLLLPLRVAFGLSVFGLRPFFFALCLLLPASCLLPPAAPRPEGPAGRLEDTLTRPCH